MGTGIALVDKRCLTDYSCYYHYQNYSLLNLLWICIVGTAPSVITGDFTALRVVTSDAVRKQHSTDHSWHYHHKHGKNFQKASKNGTSSGLDVVLGAQGSLNKDLNLQMTGMFSKEVESQK